jgi:hypothetical protein
LIIEELAKKIEDAGLEAVEVRSPLTCEAKKVSVLNVTVETLQQVKESTWVKQ